VEGICRAGSVSKVFGFGFNISITSLELANALKLGPNAVSSSMFCFGMAPTEDDRWENITGLG
jgi:hypothetical protein